MHHDVLARGMWWCAGAGELCDSMTHMGSGMTEHGMGSGPSCGPTYHSEGSMPLRCI